MPYLQTPSGKYLEVPEGLSEEEAEALAKRQFPALYGIKPTLGGYLKEIPKGAAAGFVGSLATAARGIGALLPEEMETPFARGVKAAEQTLTPEAAPGYEESFIRKLAEAGGSMASFAIPGGLAGLLGKTAGAARAAQFGVMAPLAAASGAGEARQRAEEAGATPEERRLATQLGVLPGLTDVLPVERLLKIAPPGTLEKATDYIKRALTTGGMEAAQEAAQNFAQNLIAKGIYKPEQALVEGVGEGALYGGAAGALAQGLLDLTLGRRAAGAARRAKAEEEAQRQAAAREIAQKEEQVTAWKAQPPGTQQEAFELSPEEQAAKEAAPAVKPVEEKEAPEDLLRRQTNLQNYYDGLTTQATAAREAGQMDAYNRIMEQRKKVKTALDGANAEAEAAGAAPTDAKKRLEALRPKKASLEKAIQKKAKEGDEDAIKDSLLPKLQAVNDEIAALSSDALLAGIPTLQQGNIEREAEAIAGIRPDFAARAPELRGAETANLFAQQQELAAKAVENEEARKKAEREAEQKAFAQAKYTRSVNAYAELLQKQALENTPFLEAEGKRGEILYGVPKKVRVDKKNYPYIERVPGAAVSPPTYTPKRQTATKEARESIPEKAVLPALRQGFVTPQAIEVLGLDLPTQEYDVTKPEDAKAVLAAANKLRITLAPEVKAAAVPVVKLLNKKGRFTKQAEASIVLQGRLQELIKLQQKAAQTLRSAQTTPAEKALFMAAEGKDAAGVLKQVEEKPSRINAEQQRDSSLDEWDKRLTRLYNGDFAEYDKEVLKRIDYEIEARAKKGLGRSPYSTHLVKKRQEAQMTLRKADTSLAEIFQQMDDAENAYIAGQLNLANAVRSEAGVPSLTTDEQLKIALRIKNTFKKHRADAGRTVTRVLDNPDLATLFKKQSKKTVADRSLSKLKRYLERVAGAVETVKREYKITPSFELKEGVSPQVRVTQALTRLRQQIKTTPADRKTALQKQIVRLEQTERRLATASYARQEALQDAENALQTRDLDENVRAALEEAADRLAKDKGTSQLTSNAAALASRVRKGLNTVDALEALQESLTTEREIATDRQGQQRELFAPTEQQEVAQLKALTKGGKEAEAVFRGKHGPVEAAIVFNQVASLRDEFDVITKQLQSRKQKLEAQDAKAKELRTKLHNAETAVLELAIANKMHTPVQKVKTEERKVSLQKQINGLAKVIADKRRAMQSVPLNEAARAQNELTRLGQRLAKARDTLLEINAMQAELAKAETTVFAARVEYAAMLSAYPVEERVVWNTQNLVKNFTAFFATDRVKKLKAVVAEYQAIAEQAKKKENKATQNIEQGILKLQQALEQGLAKQLDVRKTALQEYFNALRASRVDEVEALMQMAYYAEELRIQIAAKENEIKSLQETQRILEARENIKTLPIGEAAREYRLLLGIKGVTENEAFWTQIENAKEELQTLKEVATKAQAATQSASEKARSVFNKLPQQFRKIALQTISTQQNVRDAEIALVTAKLNYAQALKQKRESAVAEAERALAKAKQEEAAANASLFQKIGALGRDALKGIGTITGVTTVTQEVATKTAEQVRNLRLSRAIKALETRIKAAKQRNAPPQRIAALTERLENVKLLAEYPHKVTARIKLSAEEVRKHKGRVERAEAMLQAYDKAKAEGQARRSVALASQIGQFLGITGRTKELWASTGFNLHKAVRAKLRETEPVLQKVITRENIQPANVVDVEQLLRYTGAKRPATVATAIEESPDPTWFKKKFTPDFKTPAELETLQKVAPKAYWNAVEAQDKAAMDYWSMLAEQYGLDLTEYSAPVTEAAEKTQKANVKAFREAREAAFAESRVKRRSTKQKTGVQEEEKAPSWPRTLDVNEFFDDDNGAFRLSKEAGGGVDTVAAQGVADAVRANLPSNVQLTYAPTVKDIPANFKKAIEASGQDIAKVKGLVLPTGEVLVVGDAHTSVADLEETFAHELIGHYSVDTVLGPERFKKLVNDLYSRPGGTKHILQVAADLGIYESVAEAEQGMARAGKSEEALRTALVREMIAHAAEGRPVKQSAALRIKDLWRSIIDAFKDALSAMGFGSMAARDAREIQRIIRNAHAAFAADKLGVYQAPSGEVAFSVKALGGDPRFNDLEETLYGQQTPANRSSAMKSWGFQAMTSFVDRFHFASLIAGSMKDALKATQMQYYLRQTDFISNYATSVATTGPIKLIKKKDERTGKDFYYYDVQNGASLKNVAKMVSTLGFGNSVTNESYFGMYITALRAEDPDVGYDKVGISKDAQAKLKDFKQWIDSPANADKKALMDKARDELRKYNAGLIDFLEQTGAVDAEKAAQMRGRKDFIPYYRQMDDGSVMGFIDDELPFRVGDIKSQPFLHELVGGKQAIHRPFNALMMNTNLLLSMGFRNQAKKDLAFTLADLSLVDPTKSKNKETGKTTEIPIRNGYGSGDNVINFKIDGVEKHIVINTAGTAFDYIPSSLIVKGMEGVPTLIPWYVRALSAPMRVLRKAIILDPAYAPRQIIKDSIGSYITTGADFIPVLDSLRAIKDMGKEGASPYVGGVPNSQILSGTPDDFAVMMRQIADSSSFSWLAKMESIGMKADAANRRVMYNSFKQQGLNELEAQFAAQEAINFRTRGTSASMYHLGMMIPFFNAGVQSINVLAKAMTGKMPFNERLNVRSKLYTRGLAMAGMTLAYWAMVHDEDWYKEIPEQQRLQNWFFKIPGVKDPLRIPIPFEAGLVFKALPEAIFAAANNDKDAAPAMNAFAKAALSMLPIAPTNLIPTGVKPLLQVAVNKDFYSGQAIESAREQKLDVAERFRPGTTEFAKALSSFGVPLSPVQIDSLIRGYLGGLGLEVTSMLNPAITSFAPTTQGEEPEEPVTRAPFVRSFFQPLEARAIIDRAYEFMDEAEQRKNTYAKMVEEGRDEEADRYLAKYEDEIAYGKDAVKFRAQMGKITKAEREIRNDPSMSGVDKRKWLEELRAEKKETARAYASGAF